MPFSLIHYGGETLSALPFDNCVRILRSDKHSYWTKYDISRLWPNILASRLQDFDAIDFGAS